MNLCHVTPAVFILASCAAPLDVRRCPVSVATLTPHDAAVRCAEAFVERNGYTARAPVDSVDLASESIEFTSSLAELLKLRYNTLEPRAVALCGVGRRSTPGYTVLFRYRRSPVLDAAAKSLGLDPRLIARAVTKSPQFDRLRMEHQDVDLSRLGNDSACTTFRLGAA